MNRLKLGVIIILLIAGISIYFTRRADNTLPSQQPPQENQTQSDDSDSSDDPELENTFRKNADGQFLGTAQTSGYLQVERRTCEPGQLCSETVDYAKFVLTDNPGPVLTEFLSNLERNSFAGPQFIGLGCLQPTSARIFYINDSDDGTFEGQISGSDLVELRQSSQTNPITLNFERKLYTGGRGAPDCYAHFRNMEVTN